LSRDWAGGTDRAHKLDAKLEADVLAISLPSFKEVSASIRAYLLKQNSEIDKINNVYKILKGPTRSSSVGFITIGPQFDKEATDSHYRLKSGARLSFGMTLSEANGKCSLVAYRFHIHLGDVSGLPSFYRFDLNESRHATPLVEPRSHIHAGSDEVRLPFPAMSPFEILDRIFHVICKAE
jgi:hypothetical protein